MDYRLAMMCGIDLPVPQCQIAVHQPRIKEIGMIGEQDFFIGATQIVLTDEFAGLCLLYEATHGGEDKKYMPNPKDEERFIQDFNDMVNN